ncbi:MAG TPA: sigma-70 family RNA polymerase sigma factor [Terriglobales bacterium]|nr:sigma-70 family RNA polymerase sigma factor [Terriglobales bacterium]
MKSRSGAPEKAWSDERLVRECCQGNQAAWSALLDKYKNLIFSIPVKSGLSRDDAADIFQAVSLDLLADLPKLRDPKALPKWLIQTSYHKCLRWEKDRFTSLGDDIDLKSEEGSSAHIPEKMLYQLQQEQFVREAMSGLSPRCRRMIAMLFFESPPRPYQVVAKELGLATGSIGFIRGRCLGKLRQALEKKGFK